MLALAVPSFAEEPTAAVTGNSETAKSDAQTATSTERETNKNPSNGNAETAKSETQTANATELETNKNLSLGEAETTQSDAQIAEQGNSAAEKPIAKKSLVLVDSAFYANANGNAETEKGGSSTANSTEPETNKNPSNGNAETEKSETQTAKNEPRQEEQRESIPWARSEEFDPNVLLRKEDYWPERLSVHYQFSFGMMASSTGASRGGGLYLGIIRYDLAPNLIFSSAVGFSTTFWATSDKNHPDGFRNEDTMKPEFRLPYAALDYYPADNMHLRVQVGDGSDCGGGILRRRACDAWGY